MNILEELEEENREYFEKAGGELYKYIPCLNDNPLHIYMMTELIKKHTQVKVYGHVKSIYETSDQVGSCQFLIDRSDDVASFNEISISTGKSHGAFYNPLPVWVEPVKQWITDNTQN
mgnify:CR=1 FL=1